MSDEKRDYEVGYGKPPKSTRFKPGQSGNPKGRVRGQVNLLTDVLAELAEQIDITERGQSKRISKQRGVVKALVSRSLKGEARAAALLIGLLTKLAETDSAKDDEASATPTANMTDQEILDAFLRRTAHPASESQEPSDDE